MTHTKEPWRVDVCSPDMIFADGPDVAMCLEGNDEANARRIVSCVNALAGYDPDALAGLLEKADNLIAEAVADKSLVISDELDNALSAFIAALARLRGEA